ncbi:hypothetical protein P171DRAFT_491075 [Karstenula rhodostoma CBS 690.94]|uniref:Uncharacterized protein n=1 Tax=Karstenula rhodostoma CBS 690.94 TaxID=1392251 RepID=A0A9P4P7R2_9PLEO|nr:hypothetical protein P171DRAFT_491075 [Karstenula rhodostoma CBS 690.94]
MPPIDWDNVSPRSSDGGRSAISFGRSDLDSDSTWDSSSPGDSVRSTEAPDNTGKIYENDPSQMDQNEGKTPNKTERNIDEYVKDNTEVATFLEKDMKLPPDEKPILPGTGVTLGPDSQPQDQGSSSQQSS